MRGLCEAMIYFMIDIIATVFAVLFMVFIWVFRDAMQILINMQGAIANALVEQAKIAHEDYMRKMEKL